MKKFVALFVVAFVTLSLAMCSSPSDSDSEEQFESYRVGTWLVTSPQSADWEGSKANKSFAKSSSDTVVVERSGDISLSVVKDTADTEANDVLVTFIDSSFTDAEMDSIDLGNSRISFPSLEERNYNFDIGGQTVGVGNGRLINVYDANYDCGTSLEGFEILQLDLPRPDGTLYRAYQLDIHGLEDVLSDVSC